MRSRTEIVVAAGGVLRRNDCRPPLTIRQVRADDPATCALCLVGTAAGPLDGDDWQLGLHVEPHAVAALRATGATLAQGGASTYRTAVRVEDGARLRGRPGPLVVTAAAAVDVRLTIALGTDVSLDWREVVVLGRSGEPAGAATVRWDVTAGGRPVLRQRVDVGAGDWRGVRDRHRVLATALVTAPDLDARTVVRSPSAVAARLDERTVLATVLADDVATACRDVDALLAGRHG